jgi:hypothetical protein
MIEVNEMYPAAKKKNCYRSHFTYSLFGAEVRRHERKWNLFMTFVQILKEAKLLYFSIIKSVKSCKTYDRETNR